MPTALCTDRPEFPFLKIAAYISALLGLALLLALFVRADFPVTLQTFELGGWKLLWLVPYRLVFFALYASGWLILLKPRGPQRHATFGYVLWVTSVREAIDRLLPVASIGGGIVAVRLMRWRGLTAAPIAASVIVEVVLTIIVAYVFTALGLLLLIDVSTAGQEYRRMVLALLFSLPVPIGAALLLRYGSVFKRLLDLLRPLVGESALTEGAVSLDREVSSGLRRGRSLVVVGALQFAAFVSGSFEIWFALRLFGHPVGMQVALILESMMQAVRHLAFFVPAALGVQEGALVLFGQAFGISPELALAVSMAKRMREILCGLPALLSWQWLEGRRLIRPTA
jgi:putative membrane protein